MIEDPYKVLLNKALRFLSFRPRSVAEVTKYLEKSGVDSQVVNQVMTKLTTSKLVDDAEFAKWYSQSRANARPRSHWLIQKELQKFGVEIDLSQTEIEPDVDLAQKLLKQKMTRHAKLPWQEYKTKAARLLYSKGFSWSIIEKAAKKEYNKADVNYEP